MKQLNKKSINSVRFVGAAYNNSCCAISATWHHINVLGQKF